MFRRLHLSVCSALILTVTVSANAQESNAPLVFISDFGTTERFVASMKGVAMTVDPTLQIHDLTHHIEPHNIWQASFVLTGTIAYWPEGTVFVSVVDPGVGTTRKSVVAKTGTGHYIVTPDNGTLTLIADEHGIVALREIDESVNRRPGTAELHTFHGRDVYAYTGSRLAAGVIDFEGVGPLLDAGVVRLAYQKPKVLGDGTVIGNLVHVEQPFGNIVTNIPAALLASLGMKDEDNNNVQIVVTRDDEIKFDREIPYANSFGFVDLGEPLLYSDSLQTIGLAINSGSIHKKFGIGAGQQWMIRINSAVEKE